MFLTQSSGKEPNRKPKLSEKDFQKFFLYQTYSRSLWMSWSCCLEMQMRTGVPRVSSFFSIQDSQSDTFAALSEVLKADHGFNVESRAIRDLIDVMASYDVPTRREYLQFITGSPKLPIGGEYQYYQPYQIMLMADAL
jgi:hypothetical protein